MTVAEKIFQHVNELPERFQVEVLDFVEFIETKTSRANKELTERGSASLTKRDRSQPFLAAKSFDGYSGLYTGRSETLARTS